ncbi:MAG: glycosyltransferase [Prevotella sp.]|nr:glycosyltransferase [Candidatus Prevotella equi]
MRYSIIIPVFNRPDEVDELLDSLTRQVFDDFEVLVIEDGSSIPCNEVCKKYNDRLTLRYYKKDNSGPGQTRNFGAERANGEYLIILDSDVVLPEGYLTAVEEELRQNPCDAFGGADASHPSFTPVQKAISYSMTSFFTTGGIRGGKKKLDRFYPRSYNMGIRRDVYLRLNGFSKMRFGEDIDFSYRIIEAGCSSRLFPKAWVWHKRRTDLRKFFRQVYNSGIARINLEKRHPGTMKLVHMLPMVFTVGVIALVLISAVSRALMHYEPTHFWLWYALCITALMPLALYAIIIFIDSFFMHRSIKIAGLSIAAAFVQLMGYGFGFIEAWWKRCVRKKDEFQAFEKTFYK